MSPILVRPVREQLEHDRIIRLLHGKSRRKYEAGMNPGAEQNAPVGSGHSKQSSQASADGLYGQQYMQPDASALQQPKGQVQQQPVR